jgi:Fe-S-cluster containining protein
MSQDSGNVPSVDTAAFQELIQSDSQDDFISAVRLAASRILTGLHVEEDRLEEILEEIEKDSYYQDYKNSWEDLAPEERARKWPQQLERIIQTGYASRPYCLRCGECCSRVSPSLHHEDLELFKEGILRYGDVYTLRKGEPVLDNIKGSLDNLSEELIKIKEVPESRQCFFFDEAEKSCRIYDRRPLQCRTQECWNPQALEQLWRRNKLTRRDFLKNDDAGLMDLLEIHDERCSTEKLDSAVKHYWETGETAALDPVVDMLSQDMIIRNFFIEKMGRNEEELDFLLGRPLAKIVESYNLIVEKDENGAYHLIQVE